jgi:hypothetical protein
MPDDVAKTSTSEILVATSGGPVAPAIIADAADIAPPLTSPSPCGVEARAASVLGPTAASLIAPAARL